MFASSSDVLGTSTSPSSLPSATVSNLTAKKKTASSLGDVGEVDGNGVVMHDDHDGILASPIQDDVSTQSHIDPSYYSLESLNARAMRWFKQSGAMNKMIKSHLSYSDYLKLASSLPVPQQILLDVDRTLPEVYITDSPSTYEFLTRALETRHKTVEESRKELLDVLSAFIAAFEYPGYSQGMNFIAYLLITVMDTPEHAFWTLATVVQDMKLKDFYESEKCAGLLIDYAVLTDICFDVHKGLVSLVGEGAMQLLVQMIAPKCLISLSLPLLPMETSLLVLDEYFAQPSKHLEDFRIASPSASASSSTSSSSSSSSSTPPTLVNPADPPSSSSSSSSSTPSTNVTNTHSKPPIFHPGRLTSDLPPAFDLFHSDEVQFRLVLALLDLFYQYLLDGGDEGYALALANQRNKTGRAKRRRSRMGANYNIQGPQGGGEGEGDGDEVISDEVEGEGGAGEIKSDGSDMNSDDSGPRDCTVDACNIGSAVGLDSGSEEDGGEGRRRRGRYSDADAPIARPRRRSRSTDNEDSGSGDESDNDDDDDDDDGVTDSDDNSISGSDSENDKEKSKHKDSQGDKDGEKKKKRRRKGTKSKKSTTTTSTLTVTDEHGVPEMGAIWSGMQYVIKTTPAYMVMNRMNKRRFMIDLKELDDKRQKKRLLTQHTLRSNAATLAKLRHFTPDQVRDIVTAFRIAVTHSFLPPVPSPSSSPSPSPSPSPLPPVSFTSQPRRLTLTDVSSSSHAITNALGLVRYCHSYYATHDNDDDTNPIDDVNNNNNNNNNSGYTKPGSSPSASGDSFRSVTPKQGALWPLPTNLPYRARDKYTLEQLYADHLTMSIAAVGALGDKAFEVDVDVLEAILRLAGVDPSLLPPSPASLLSKKHSENNADITPQSTRPIPIPIVEGVVSNISVPHSPTASSPASSPEPSPSQSPSPFGDNPFLVGVDGLSQLHANKPTSQDKEKKGDVEGDRKTENGNMNKDNTSENKAALKDESQSSSSSSSSSPPKPAQVMRSGRLANGKISPFHRLFAVADVDEDGVADFRDIVTLLAMNIKGKTDYETRLEMVFAMHDSDGDMLLTHSELKHLVVVLQNVALGQPIPRRGGNTTSNTNQGKDGSGPSTAPESSSLPESKDNGEQPSSLPKSTMNERKEAGTITLEDCFDLVLKEPFLRTSLGLRLSDWSTDQARGLPRRNYGNTARLARCANCGTGDDVCTIV